jgi:hypothetical protein
MTKTMTSPPAAKGCSKGPLYSRTVSLWRHDGRVPSGADRSGDFLELALEPIGLLLSTPMTVCPLVLGRHVPQQQFLDVILGNEPVLTPEETFYQRILANDPEEASEQPRNTRRVVRFLNSLTRLRCLLWPERRPTPTGAPCLRKPR